MKISRVPFAVSLVMLAAAPPLVPSSRAAVAPSKPPAEGADPERDAWRAQAMAVCVGALRSAEGVTADELDATCGCAIDRFMMGRRIASLPVIVPGRLRTELGSPLLACATEQRPAIAAALALVLAAPPTATVPTDDSKPVETPAPVPADASKRSGFNLQAWLDGLSLPSWLTDSGLPPWAWVPLGFLAFGLLRALFRSGDGRDLIGPPPSMRLGTRHNQPEPRRADPPQRS